MLFCRAEIFSPVLSAKALTQEVITNFWACVERACMNFIRLNQEKLKSKSYGSLVASLKNQGKPSGNKFILPLTFSGGPRAMAQLYQDSMAIYQKYGALSLFMTMTANPKWVKVSSSIPQGAKPHNNLVETAHVFCQKLKELVRQIGKMGRFGKFISYVSTIEFQKRGLPHLHLMVTLKVSDCPTTPEDIDLLVTAEFPNPMTKPLLRRLVVELNLHGPCNGRLCWQKGGCNKGFPKPYAEKTANVEGAYIPIYKCRNNGQTVIINGITFDNRLVVPYNNFLTLMFQCHINVEIPVNTTAIKYLYKYITK
jgi:hypothetical protein